MQLMIGIFFSVGQGAAGGVEIGKGEEQAGTGSCSLKFSVLQKKNLKKHPVKARDHHIFEL